MLKVTRNRGEGLVIGDDVRVYYLGQKDGQINLGIEAPKHISVDRKELRERKNRMAKIREAENG